MQWNIATGLFITIYHVVLLGTWIWYFPTHTPSLGIVLTTIALYFVTGISITAGYHRYFSHISYKTNRWIEGVLLFFGSMAAQGSALRWAFDHRLHHAYVDTEQDPYAITKGFWHAHILWLFRKPRTIDQKVVSDLFKNKMVLWQHKYYALCLVGTNVLAFLAAGWIFGDYVGAFVLVWWTRLFALHHSTWCINSLAHFWGEQRFSQEHSAVDNYVISLLTFGEGYHNYHHTFANDYRNGIRWYHFDPTKWLIWTLDKLGWASGLKTVNSFHIKERIVMERRKELFGAIQESPHDKKEALMTTAGEICTSLLAKLQESKQLVEEYVAAKRDAGSATSRQVMKRLKDDLVAVRKSFRQQWKQCNLFTRYVMRLSPQAA